MSAARASIAASLVALLASTNAGAAPPRPTLKATFEAGSVRIEACRDGRCNAAAFALPADATSPQVTSVELGGVRPGLLVEAPATAGAAGRYALLATVDDEGSVRELVHGWLDRPRGEPGARTTRVLSREAAARGEQVVLGARSERHTVCGRVALTGAMRLDPESLDWVPAPTRSLPDDERAAAHRLFAVRSASALEGRPNLLEAVTATSGGERRVAATDGSLATAWTEDAPGPGEGEAIVMRASADVPIEGIRFVVEGTGDPESRATPRTFYVVADGAAYHVTMPEDASLAPAGTAYEVALPASVRAECVALVLEAPYRPEAERVGFREIHAITSLDAVGGFGELVPLLDDEARAEAARVLFRRGGAPAVRALVAGYARLGPRGRGLAIERIASGSCADTASFDVGRAVGLVPSPTGERDGEGAGVDDPLPRLRECRAEAAPLLRAIAAGPGADAPRGAAARWLAHLEPVDAVAVVVGALEGASPELRRDLRDVLHLSARSPSSASTLGEMLGATRFSRLSLQVRVELLRGLTAALPTLPGASAAFASAASEPGFATRFLLLGPAASLARSGDAAASKFLAEAIVAAPNAHLRAAAAEAASGLPALEPELSRALSDASPRVRRAALGSLAGLPRDGASTRAAALLRDDPWTFVRLAAASALGAAPPNPAATAALLGATRDPSPAVRRAVLAALGKGGDRSAGRGIEAVADDATEDPDVRAAAVLALGGVCRSEAGELLYKLALRTGTPELGYDRPLGMAALSALRALRLDDRAARLGPLLRDPRTPKHVKAIVREVVAAPGRCGEGAPLNARAGR